MLQEIQCDMASLKDFEVQPVSVQNTYLNRAAYLLKREYILVAGSPFDISEDIVAAKMWLSDTQEQINGTKEIEE